MKNKKTVSTFALYRAWLKSLDLSPGNLIAPAAVILGCVALGLVSLRLPVHHAYLRAKVKTVTVRFGSKRPGAFLLLELDDGRIAAITTRFIHPDLREGAVICVQELKGKWRKRHWFEHAPASHCLTDGARAAGG